MSPSQSFLNIGRRPTSVPGPSRWDGDEDSGKIHFIVPKFWEKNRMRSATQLYCKFSLGPGHEIWDALYVYNL